MKALPLGTSHGSYLEDESHLRGSADSIAFPESAEDISRLLFEAAEKEISVTIQGSRTGLCGGAVPEGGLIINLEKMCRLSKVSEADGSFSVSAEAGVRLSDIERLAASRGLFFPPDPTEKSASLGGMFATGGAGSSSLRYGASSAYVSALTWLGPSGKIWHITRGEYIFDGERFKAPGGDIFERPENKIPPHKRGLLREGCDLIDFLSGTEALFGVAAELTLRLLPALKELWGLMFFFRDKAAARAFLERLPALRDKRTALFRCAECYDRGALELLERGRELNPLAGSLPPFPPNALFAVYLELEGDDSSEIEAALTELLDIFSDSGGPEEDSWAESGAMVGRFRDMRHAVPELVGVMTGFSGDAPLRERLETDFSGPPERAWDYIEMLAGDAAKVGLDCAVYGHVLQNCLHAAILYKSADERERGLELCAGWEKRVNADGGSHVAENGMGRLKSRYISETGGENHA